MSTEDYDGVFLPFLPCISSSSVEFGNYIGGDLESEDESDIEDGPAAVPPAPPGMSTQPAQGYAPLEGLEDEDEDMEESGMEMTLHGVDGARGAIA